MKKTIEQKQLHKMLKHVFKQLEKGEKGTAYIRLLDDVHSVNIQIGI